MVSHDWPKTISSFCYDYFKACLTMLANDMQGEIGVARWGGGAAGSRIIFLNDRKRPFHQSGYLRMMPETCQSPCDHKKTD